MIGDYNELTLGRYYELQALIDAEESEDMRHFRAVQYLSGIDEDALWAMPLPEYERLKEKASFVFYKPICPPVRKSYTVGEWELVPVRSPKKMSAAQFIDFKEVCKQPGEHLAEVLCCFLIPKGGRYAEGYELDEMRDAILAGMSVVDANALAAFFLSRWIRYSTRSLRSLAWMILTNRSLRAAMKREEIQEALTTIHRAAASIGSGAG